MKIRKKNFVKSVSSNKLVFVWDIGVVCVVLFFLFCVMLLVGVGFILMGLCCVVCLVYFVLIVVWFWLVCF